MAVGIVFLAIQLMKLMVTVNVSFSPRRQEVATIPPSPFFPHRVVIDGAAGSSHDLSESRIRNVAKKNHYFFW